jgi:hypothetical protein
MRSHKGRVVLRLGILACVLVGVAPTTMLGEPALASTARVVTVGCGRDFCNYAVDYRADAGEANSVVVESLSPRVVINDAGATIRAGSACRSNGPHAVSCERLDGSVVRFWLRDRSDSLRVRGTGCMGEFADFCNGVEAYGGTGSDYLEGADGRDKLYGGPGRDELLGEGSDDYLRGDPGGTISQDTIDGGPGSDVASYNGRSVHVRIDLDHPARSGSRGENDRLYGIESVFGGKGNDILAGDAGPNMLRGGPGSDLLRGRAGNDMLEGGSGNDTLVGGPGADRIYTYAFLTTQVTDKQNGRDDVLCGAGTDTVGGPQVHDLIDQSCEAVEPYGMYEHVHLHLPLAAYSAPVLSLDRYFCPDRRRCKVRMRLWTASRPKGPAPGILVGDRVLLIVGPNKIARHKKLRLNKRGGALLARYRTIRVRIEYSPEPLPRPGFLVDLRAPPK